MAMLLTIVIVFAICWTPATFVFTFSGIWSSMPQILWPIAIWLAFCNSGMNSLIYGVMNKHFRTGYMELFEYMFCCKRYVILILAIMGCCSVVTPCIYSFPKETRV